MKLYADAPRCPECQQKAVLLRRQAEHLERFTKGGLAAYRCPVDNGWHVHRDPRTPVNPNRCTSS